MVPTPAGPAPEATPATTDQLVPPPRPGPGLQLQVPMVRFTGGQADVNRQVAAAAGEYGMFAVDRPDLAEASRQLTSQARAALAIIDSEPATRELVTARPQDGRYAGYSPPEHEALGHTAVDHPTPDRAAAGDGPAVPPDLRRSWTWTTDGPSPWEPLPRLFQTSAEEWAAAAMRLLTHRILPGLSDLVGIDLADHYGVGRGAARGVCRFNDYPVLSGPPSPRQMRTGAHRDYGPLTLLIPDGPGLQLQHAGRWWSVHHQPGQVLVNVGQELAALAALQGEPQAVAPALHRVVPPRGRSRRSSLVCFWYGHPHTVVDREDGQPITSQQFTQRRVDAQTAAGRR